MNLFDVHTDCQDKLASKPRKATDQEIVAYAHFLRERRGLPDMGAPDLHFCEVRSGGGRRGYERGHCIGATFGKRTAAPTHVAGRWEGDDYFPGVSTPAQYETGAFSIAFPGHDMHRQAVTFEALGEGGEVLSSQTLPAEPKKGGVIWTRDDVRAAFGPIAKKGKRGKAVDAPTPVQSEAPAPAMPEICQPEAAGSDLSPGMAQEGGEAPGALHGPESGPVELVSETCELPGDPLADLAARVAALEVRIAALPAESTGAAVNGEKIEVAPSGEVARPRRTAAHERAIRRAWAARIEARRQRAIAADHMRMREQVQEALRTASADFATAETVIRSMETREKALKADVERLTADCAEWEALQHRTWGDKVGERLKRRASAARARRLLASTRKAATFQRQRADVLAAQLDKLRSDMADPSQPERASDLARLVMERDQARTALAATDARNRAMKAALDDLADKFEAMASRLAVAEAAMRRAG